MPICVSCRVPHHTEDCDQHKPPNTAVSGQPVAGAGVAPGGECWGGDTRTGGRAVGVVDETVHDEGDTVDVVDLFAGAGGWRRWAGAGMNTKGTYDDAAQEVEGQEPIEVGDLLDDPRTDAEALCLCPVRQCQAGQ